MPSQTDRKEITVNALRDALEVYSREVMDKKNWVKKGGRDQYRFAISKERVYEIANVRSRSTLSLPYYRQIRIEISDAIAQLKKDAGKRKEIDAHDDTHADFSVEILKQIIVAQDFEIARLQSQLNLPQKVVSIDKNRKWSG